jgi:uncharacterized protein YcfL
MWESFKKYLQVISLSVSLILLPSCGFFGKTKENLPQTLKPVEVYVYGSLKDKIQVSNPVVTKQGNNTVIQFVVTNKSEKRLSFLYKVFPYDINNMYIDFPQNGWNQGYLDPNDSDIFRVVLPVSIQKISKVEIRLKDFVGF